MARPRAGNLDRVIEIQAATESRNSAGEVVMTWARFLRCYANVQSDPANETFGANRQLGIKTKKFTIRHARGVTAQHRILYEDEYYDILALSDMEEVGRRRFIQIVATSVEGQQYGTK